MARGWTSSACKGPPSRSVSARLTLLRAIASTTSPDSGGAANAANKRRLRAASCVFSRKTGGVEVKMLAAVFASVLYALAIGSAYAHGDHPSTHGGTVGRGDDEIVVEFVMEKGMISLYVHDEAGKPFAINNVSGTLTLVPPQHSAQEVKLVQVGYHKFTAPGIEPVPGDRLRARITLPSGQEL